MTATHQDTKNTEYSESSECVWGLTTLTCYVARC